MIRRGWSSSMILVFTLLNPKLCSWQIKWSFHPCWISLLRLSSSNYTMTFPSATLICWTPKYSLTWLPIMSKLLTIKRLSPCHILQRSRKENIWWSKLDIRSPCLNVFASSNLISNSVLRVRLCLFNLSLVRALKVIANNENFQLKIQNV